MQTQEIIPPNTKNTISKTFRSTTTDKLWHQSENTIHFVSPHVPFHRQKRFKWSSIYWPKLDEGQRTMKIKQKSQTHNIADKISKIIDQEQKNQIRNRKAKKTLSQSRSHSIKSPQKAKQQTFNKQAYILTKKNLQVLEKLTALKTKKQSLLRDRHGNRCNLWEDPQKQQINQSPLFLGLTTGFTTSTKINLQRPHNFYPGPGTYQIKRFLSDMDSESFEPDIPKRQFPKIDRR